MSNKSDIPQQYMRAKRAGTLNGRTYSEFRDDIVKSRSSTETLTVGNHIFRVVDTIPPGYTVWTIGENMSSGYVALAKNTDSYHVDTTSLLALKSESADAIMKAASFSPVNGSSDPARAEAALQKYHDRHINSKNSYTKRKAHIAGIAAAGWRVLRRDGKIG